MANNARILPTEPSANRNSEERRIQNEILLDLSRKECESALANLEFVRLKPGQVLHECGEPLKSGYFCNSGLFSVLNAMPDGKLVTVGLIGKEGFAGMPLLAGFRTGHARTIVQLEATAYRVHADHLERLLRDCPIVERGLQRYSQLLTLQVMQTAACNQLHEVHERLARWLLMVRDRLSCDSLALTQDTLSQMIGTRRASVTVAACFLQRARLISYKRGIVTILNRRGLERSACECYRHLQEQVEEWQRQTG
jgi:CRP-like cAMP-binding protein